MVVFHHSDTGTSEDAWLADPALRRAAQITLPDPPGALVVLAAHPDDETLGAGGTIAAAARVGLPVQVVLASTGEASHPHSPTHRPDDLATIRRREAANAVAELAPCAVLTFLALPDGRLADHVEEITAALRDVVAPTTGDTLLLTPWCGDEHPDHAACSAAAAAVAAAEDRVTVAEYPIWFWHWGDPDGHVLLEDRLRRMDLDPEDAAAKVRAMECYPSQSEPLSAEPGDEPILLKDFTAHFTRDFEIFVDTSPRPAASSTYFEDLYAEADDPWGLGTRWYEQRKRSILLASLPRRRFDRVFEAGCALGHLSQALADRADELVAVDAVARAVELTRARLAGRPGTRVERMAIPGQWPAGRFDLIVLSEVGYYCPDLSVLARRIDESLTSDGVLVLCHWRHPAPDHPHTAATVHQAVRTGTALHVLVTHVEDDFLLEVLSRSGRSVAVTEGIVTAPRAISSG